VIGEQRRARPCRLARRAWISHEWKTTDRGGPALDQAGACLVTGGSVHGGNWKGAEEVTYQ
jgi:hypothetical protein